MPYLLPDFIIEKHVKNALEEDIGFGDITTDAVYEQGQQIKAVFNSRAEGVLCGVKVLKTVYSLLDSDIEIEILKKDGEKIHKGDDLVIVKGNCRGILTGERVALNYLQRMSAIATLANKFQQAVEPYSAKVVDTRKTTPGFRAFEKYAVSIGGAGLHRFNLSDCVMLKDNHIAYVGSIEKAVKKVRQSISHAHKIEVEVENIDQVNEAVKAGADIIMLDNMTIEQMKEAVELIKGSAIIEASGNVSLESVNKIASTGVDVISTSAMQAKAGSLDIGLDYC